MIQKSITIEHAVAVLNEALELDPDAVSELVGHRVSCNERLAEHPTIQVWVDKVGILGILNGLFGADSQGFGAIAADIEDETGKVTGFKVISSRMGT